MKIKIILFYLASCIALTSCGWGTDTIGDSELSAPIPQSGSEALEVYQKEPPKKDITEEDASQEAITEKDSSQDQNIEEPGIVYDNTHPIPVDFEFYAKNTLEHIIKERTDAGKREISTNEAITKMAQRRAQELEIAFTDERPNGTSFATVFDEFEHNMQSHSIIILSGNATPNVMIADLMGQSEYNSLLLGDDVDNIGVGVHRGKDGKIYWAILLAQEIVRLDNEMREEYAQEVLFLVNEVREKEGLSRLDTDAVLTEMTMVRAKEIETQYSHTRPNNTEWNTVFEEFSHDLSFYGENLAKGQLTPEETVDAWMDSEGHRANIINPDAQYLGVAVHQDKAGTLYWAQLFAILSE